MLERLPDGYQDLQRESEHSEEVTYPMPNLLNEFVFAKALEDIGNIQIGDRCEGIDR